MSIRATRKGVFVFSPANGWHKIPPNYYRAGEISDAPPDGAPLAAPEKRPPKSGSELHFPEALRFLFIQEPRQNQPSSPCARVASLGALSAAVGDGAVLVAERLFSAPVNASMGFVVVDDTNRSAQVVSSCAQALEEKQDSRLTHLTNEGFQGIQEQIADRRREREAYFGKAKFRSPRIEADYAAQIQALRRVMRPLLLVRNPPRAGTLTQAASTSGGAGLLVTYTRDEHVGRLLDGSPRSCRDLDLLSAAWSNSTPDPININPRHLPTVRPVVTVLLLCSQSTATRIVCSEEPLVRELAERVIFVKAAKLTPNSNSALNPVLLPKVFRETVSRLISARDSIPQRRLGLSRRAATALLEYARQVEKYRQERGRWFGEPVMLAGKIALIIHVCSDQQSNLISVTTMRQAISLARQLKNLSFDAVQDLVLRGEKEELNLGSTKGATTS